MKKSIKKTLFGITVETLSYWDLQGKYKDSWVEDSFIFTQKIGHQIPLPHSKNYIGSSFSTKKKNIFFILISIIFFVLLGRIFFLQILSGSNYFALAERNRQRIVQIPAERGTIYDRNGVELTKNIPKFSLAIVPQDLPREGEALEKIIKRLAEFTEKDENAIREIIKKYGAYSYESVDIIDDLDYEKALSIQISTSDLSGISIQKRSKRLYSFQDSGFEEGGEIKQFLSLSHILGYAGKLNPQELEELYSKGYLPTDSIGKTGVEKSYETELRGEYGYQKIEVNASGKRQSTLVEQVPIHGSHIHLSIDLEIQNKIEELLTTHMDAWKKEKGVAVALDPRTGEILALVSLPSFDNNDFSGGIEPNKYAEYLADENKPLFNRAISGLYPSGSTIKLAIALGALQEGIISRHTTFLSSGGLEVGSWTFKDWQIGGHGLTNVRYSLAWSVNTFYYYIGGGYGDFVGLGSNLIVDYLKKFGLANKLGIDIPNEASGFLPSKEWKEEVKKEKWYVGDTYNLSIGQGDVLVTPLQIAMLTSVVANRGTLYQPKVVKSIVNPETYKETELESIVLNKNFIDPGHIDTVKLGMRDCVVYGSCRLLSSLPLEVAGKTGTAQWNLNKDNHAWFTSFAPFNYPEIVFTVLVEEGEEGSKITTQIANDFYAWWYNYRF